MKMTTLCGFKVAATKAEEAVESILERYQQGVGSWVLTLNLEIISRARLDPDYRALVQQANFVVADGMPLVWASRLKRGVSGVPERTAGSDISGVLIGRVPASEIAIVGGENPPKALDALKIAKSGDAFIYDGVVTMDMPHIEELAESIRSHGARLIFVALGVPKQDYVAYQFRRLIPEATIIGVGGTFELIAGLKPRAPRWMQRAGLEWLFRLINEPRRLWRRYLLLYWSGAVYLLGDMIRGNPRPA